MKITHIAPNQTSAEIDGKIIFQSYDTVVAIIENGTVKITDGQPQSKTTAKHLNTFLQMHTEFESYKDVK